MQGARVKSQAAFVIAGERSGVGKTMTTIALARAFMNRGCTVQCFKVGPDFIDPGYHTAVTGRTSRNLDAFMTGPSYCRTIFYEAARGADVVIIEGVMGLYDGYGSTDKGSTASIAKLLGVPVVLILDGGSLARSAAAMVLGFQAFDPRLRLAGVIFNKIAGEHHYAALRSAVSRNTSVPVFGYIPRGQHWQTPHRHLGLVMADERADLLASVAQCAAQIEQTLDVPKILRNAACTPRKSVPHNPKSTIKIPKSCNVRVGIARDEAFCFCYQDNIEMLERRGAEIVFFSPLHDEKLPEGLQGLYLPGGYPELHAARISANRRMRRQVRSFCRSGRPVYAECGGFLYLLRALIDQRGVRHAMAGFLPATARMLSRLQRFGYVTITAAGGCPFLPPGAVIRGHEFHYSDIAGMPDCVARTFAVKRRAGQATYRDGYVMGSVLGGYPHLHFASNPAFAKNFITACAQR